MRHLRNAAKLVVHKITLFSLNNQVKQKAQKDILLGSDLAI
jgi:hypothetical protein